MPAARALPLVHTGSLSGPVQVVRASAGQRRPKLTMGTHCLNIAAAGPVGLASPGRKLAASVLEQPIRTPSAELAFWTARFQDQVAPSEDEAGLLAPAQSVKSALNSAQVNRVPKANRADHSALSEMSSPAAPTPVWKRKLELRRGLE